MINTRLPGYNLVTGFVFAVLFPVYSLAGTDAQGIRFDDGRTYGSVLQILDESSAYIPQAESDSGLKPIAYNEFSLNRRTSTGAWHIGNASADNEMLNQVGFTFRRLRLDAFNGYGKSNSVIRNTYSAVDANLFHAGTNQRYEYSGFSASNKVSSTLNLNFTHAKITSAGLEDRVVQGIGLSTSMIDLTVMEVQRGADRIGSVYSLWTNHRRHRVGLDFLKQDNGASYQSLSYSHVHNGIRYRFGFQKVENPLYLARNDNRAVFSLGFGFGSQAGRFYATESAQQGGSNSNGYLVGAGAVGAAVALSSGSSSTDTLVRSPTQHAAARRVLNEINPVSVKQNLEYGGYVFRNPDGSYSSTTPIKGQAASILLPLPRDIVAPGSVGTATYHTHAAFDPRYDNENFSPSDIAADVAFGLDGYLGTPAGAFKYHELKTGLILNLGTIAN
jgi:hypothetical protein